jgi:hypothetical protein
MSAFQMKNSLDPLIESGRLIGSDTANPKNRWQKFISTVAS